MCLSLLKVTFFWIFILQIFLFLETFCSFELIFPSKIVPSLTSSSPASNFLNPSNSSVFLGKSAFICDPDLDHIVPLAPLVDTVPSQATDIITHSLYQSIPPNSVPSFSPTSVNSDGSVHSSVSSPVSYFVPADEVRRSVRH